MEREDSIPLTSRRARPLMLQWSPARWSGKTGLGFLLVISDGWWPDREGFCEFG